MDGFIKILGVSVGFDKSEAIKALSKRKIKINENKNGIYTEGLVCSGEDIQINYSLEDYKVCKISIHWSFINRGKLNTKEETDKVYTIGRKAYEYIRDMNIWEYNEDTRYDGKIRIIANTMIDFYNKIFISTQYKTDVDSINHVGIYIYDINKEAIDKCEFEFLRSKYTFEYACHDDLNKKQGKNKILFGKVTNCNVWFKIAIVVVLFMVGFLFVQNNRYYYTNKGKVMVDKWKKEYYYLNSNGKYIKK